MTEGDVARVRQEVIIAVDAILLLRFAAQAALVQNPIAVAVGRQAVADFALVRYSVRVAVGALVVEDVAFVGNVVVVAVLA